MQMSAWAKVDLPEILSDNMVLQQQTEVKLWGTAKANAEVNISPSWTNNIYTVKTDNDGKWIAEIQTPSASYTPYTITLSDGDAITLNNILIGEVVEKNGQLEPVDRCKGSWKVSNPANAGAFSATAFNFAMMMNRVLDIPVGIINCSWGGSTVEGWLPRDIVAQYKDIDLKKDIRKEDGHDWWHHMSPTLMYNGMLKPLQNYTIKGFLWYQGESNVGKHKTYPERLKTMVELWRKEWGLGELPFYYVEIAPFGSRETNGSALLREAQFKAQSIISNSGMISTNDLVEEYEKDNIHPKNKTDVGKRLAYMALSRTYGFKGMEDMGPVYKSMEIKDGAAILSFDYAKDGFNRLKGMEGFEIAGEDKVFYPAEAEVYNNLQIKVKSDKVKNPVAVRYCFRDFKPGNVANLRELPMYPFRTDNWE